MNSESIAFVSMHFNSIVCFFIYTWLPESWFGRNLFLSFNNFFTESTFLYFFFKIEIKKKSYSNMKKNIFSICLLLSLSFYGRKLGLTKLISWRKNSPPYTVYIIKFCRKRLGRTAKHNGLPTVRKIRPATRGNLPPPLLCLSLFWNMSPMIAWLPRVWPSKWRQSIEEVLVRRHRSLLSAIIEDLRWRRKKSRRPPNSVGLIKRRPPLEIETKMWKPHSHDQSSEVISR